MASSSSSVETKSSSSSSSVATRSSSSSSSSSSSVETKSSSSSSSSEVTKSSSSSEVTKSSSSSSDSSQSSSSSSSSSSAVLDTYATKAEVVTILSSMGVTITTADVSDTLLNAAKQQIDGMTNTSWSYFINHYLYMDGRNGRVIFCPIIPIASLSEVTIIGKDLEETSFDLAGDDRQVWWDSATGKIEVIKYDTENIVVSTPSDWTIFPEGVRNVRIRGTFGKKPTESVKLLQSLIVYRSLSTTNPKSFDGNHNKEKIGNYQYQLDSYGANGNALDNQINGLVMELKDADSMWLEEI